MSKIRLFYILFSVSIVVALIVSSIVFPSVLFIYPRTFGGIITNKIFSMSLLVFLAAFCFLFVVFITKKDEKHSVSKFLDRDPIHPSILLVCILCSIVPFLISYFVLLKFPSSSDEFVLLFQARLLADGALFAAAPPVPEIFTTTWMVEQDGRWSGMYPPGWPAIIALGSVLGLPNWAVNPLLGMVSVALVYYLGSLQYSQTIAAASSLVYASSIFFIFNASSYFSHLPFAVVALSYAIFVVLFSKTQQGRYLVAAGVALSAALLIRYYPAVLMGTPLIFYLYKWRALAKGIGFLTLGGLPLAITLALYHTAAFGSPLTTGYSLQPERFAATELSLDILAGIEANLIRLWELGSWASPTLALMYVVAIVHRLRSKSLSFTDTLFPILLLGLVLYWYDGGNRYGPRYLFDGFPFFVICAVAGVFDYVRDKSEVVRNGARHVVIVTVIYSVCVLPFAATFFHKVARERSALDRLIEARGVQNAIVIVRSGISRLLPFANQDLVKNDPYLTNAVLFVRPVDGEVLTALFPSREIWAYEKMQREAPVGELVRLR